MFCQHCKVRERVRSGCFITEKKSSTVTLTNKHDLFSNLNQSAFVAWNHTWDSGCEPQTLVSESPPPTPTSSLWFRDEASFPHKKKKKKVLSEFYPAWNYLITADKNNLLNYKHHFPEDRVGIFSAYTSVQAPSESTPGGVVLCDNVEAAVCYSAVRFLLHSHSSPPQVFPLILKAAWEWLCLIKPPSLSCRCTCSRCRNWTFVTLISSCFSPERQPDQMSEQTEWLETPAWVCRAFHLICYSFLLSTLIIITYNMSVSFVIRSWCSGFCPLHRISEENYENKKQQRQIWQYLFLGKGV